MQILALAGLERSGTTTVFRGLTGLAPRDTHEGPRPGQLKLLDERLTRLGELEGGKPPVYAEIVLWDVPGHRGKEGLGRENVGKLRGADVVGLVLRGFPDPLTLAAPRPEADVAALLSELLLSDLAIIEGRLRRLAKEGRKEAEFDLLSTLKEVVENEDLMAARALPRRDVSLLSAYQLFVLKPLILILNLPDGAIPEGFPQLSAAAASLPLPLLSVWARLEAEILELELQERDQFRRELGLARPAAQSMLDTMRRDLDLISFFTVGSHEVRAWPIRKGTTAVHAAGKVHSDMERGFIRAEVVPFDDVASSGGLSKVKGRIRREDRGYEVQDGDVIKFLFSVS